MKKRDPEAAKIKAANDKKEWDALCQSIKELTARIPKSVVNGSYQKAVTYKEVANKAMKLLTAKRIDLRTARDVTSQLQQFEQ